MRCGMRQKETSPDEAREVRHKRLELSLREEPDPKSGASTNSANAARERSEHAASTTKRVQRYDILMNYARKYANFLSYTTE